LNISCFVEKDSLRFGKRRASFQKTKGIVFEKEGLRFFAIGFNF